MSGSEVQIVFTADVSEVIEGVTLIKMALNALVPTIMQVKEDFRELGDAINEALKEAASEAAAEVKAKLASLAPAAEGLKESFADLGKAIQTSLAQGATEGVSQAKTELGELGPAADQAKSHLSEAGKEGGGGLGKIKEAFGGVAEAASKAIEIGAKVREWAVHFAEAAEHVRLLANQFNLSTDMMQRLNTMATGTGVKVETLAAGMDEFNQHLSKGDQSKVFKQLGIDVKGATDSWQTMGQVADRLKNMEDGPKKAAIATKLFGDSGKDLVTVLNMGGAALEQLKQKGQEYQASDTQIAKNAQKNGEAMANGINESKIAWQGIQNVLGDALGPVLTDVISRINGLAKAFIDSYTQGGIVKVVMDGVVAVLRGIMTMCSDVGTAFTGLFAATSSDSKGWSQTIQSVVDNIVLGFKTLLGDAVTLVGGVVAGWHDLVGACDWLGARVDLALNVIDLALNATGLEFKLFAKVADDALHLRFDQIASDWQQGMGNITEIVRRKTKEIGDHFSAANKQAQNEYGQANKIDKGIRDTLAKLNAPNSPTKKTEGLPETHGRGDTHPGARTTTPPAAARPNQATPQKSGASSLMDQWREELEKQKLDEKNWGADEAQLTLDFWQKKLGLNRAKGKELEQLNHEIAQATYDVAKEKQQDELAGIQHTLAMKTEAAKQETQVARDGLQDKLQAVDDEQKAGQISASEAISQRRELNARLYQLDQTAEQKEYELKIEAMEAESNLAHQTKQRQDELKRQEQELTQQHNDKMFNLQHQQNQKLADDAKTTAAKMKTPLQQAYAALAQSWSQNIAKMLTMQQSFRDTVHNIYMGLVSVVEKAVANMVQNWLMGLIAQDVASEASHKNHVLREAKDAASSAWKSTMHSIPAPFNLVAAPIAAAAAFAGTMAYSAEGGWDVPGMAGPGIDGRGGRLSVIHPYEMVLPAGLAGGVRDMLTGRAANTNAPFSANDGGGDTHVHYHDHSGTKSAREIRENERALAQTLIKAHENGHFKGTKLSFR